ncbi:MAG: SRPBCC family protein [Sporichthyaceae bacterium]
MNVVPYTAPGRPGTVALDASIEVAAPRAVVWALISDVRRMGEWSPMCTGARAADGFAPGPGVQFRGTNRQGRHRWTTTCTIVAASEPDEIAWVVSFGGFVVSQWGYRLADLPGGGTLVTETWRDLRRFPPFRWAPAIRLVNGTRGEISATVERGLRETLTALKAVAEAGVSSA